MIAVIETGSKQYLIKPGDKIKIEKINADIGSTINFNKVLLISSEDGTNIKVGIPYIENKSISGQVLNQIKDKKQIVFKMKAKKRYKKKTGHRQTYTIVQINNF